jgi:hypothetical protein
MVMSKHINKLFSILLTLGMGWLLAAPVPGVSFSQSNLQLANDNIKIDLLMTGEKARIVRADLRYRPVGELDFITVPMTNNGFKFSVELPRDLVKGNVMEYEFAVTERDGDAHLIASNSLGDIPYKMYLDDEVLAETEKVNAVVISPLADDRLDAEDFVAVVSLLATPDSLDIGATRVFLDNTEVTDEALITPSLITYTPSVIEPGNRRMTVVFFRNDGERLNSVVWGFTVNEKRGGFAGETRTRDARWQTEGRFYVYNRLEDIATTDRSENRFRMGLDAKTTYDFAEFGTRLFFSSDESGDFQPINIYSLYAKLHWGRRSFFKVQGVDNYPSYSRYVLNNRRIRGLSTELQLGLMNISTVFGSSKREIEGSVENVVDRGELRQGNTFQRDDFGARLAFGEKTGVLFGISAYKGKDKELDDGITSELKPQENLVTGIDFVANMFRRRVVVFANLAGSVHNKDISGGTVEYDELKEVFPDIGDNLSESQYNTISDIMTLTPGLVIKPGMAFDTGVRLRFFSHYFQAKFESVNESFESFGLQTFRNDFSGLRLTHSVPLFNYSLFLNLGYSAMTYNESRDDKIDRDELNLGFSLNLGPRFPTLNFVYSDQNRKNDTDTDTGAFDEQYQTLAFGTNYGFDLASTNQNLQFRYSSTNREDAASDNDFGKSSSSVITAIVKSSFDFPLVTKVGVQNSLSEFGTSNKSAFFSYILGADYTLVKLVRNWDLQVGAYAKIGNVATEDDLGTIDIVKNLYSLNAGMDLQKFGKVYTGFDIYSLDDGEDTSNSDFYWTTRYSLNF